MKIITIELPQSVVIYLQRIRTCLPETMASLPDEKLIPLCLEQAALALDEMLQMFMREMGNVLIAKIQNPHSQTITLPNQ